MNYQNEKLRCLRQTISQYERMSALSERPAEKWEYMMKANACRHELKKLLGEVRY